MAQAKRLGGGAGLVRTGTTNPGMETSPKDDKKVIGLGFDPGPDTSKDSKRNQIVALFKEALSCQDPNYLPLVARVEWEIDGPMSPQDVQSSLGAQISLLSSGTSVAGVQKVYTTPGLIGGEFQTYNLAIGIGAHFRVNPMNFTLKGNGLLVPKNGIVSPVSPDKWSRNDMLNGALGLTWDGRSNDSLPMLPAVMRYNWWAAAAFAAFIKGFNFRWTYGTLVNIFEDQLSNTAYMPSMAQLGSSGSSQVDASDIIQRMNKFYEENASVADFLALNAIRYGSAPAGGAGANVGLFDSFDGHIVDVSYGGPGFQALSDACCGNAPYRMLRKPYLLQPGVPPGLVFEEANNDQADLFRRYMDITCGQASGVVPPILTDAGNIAEGFGPDTTTFTAAMMERTLASPPGFIAQQYYDGREVFSFSDGAFASVDILGFEIWRTVAKAIENDPEIAATIKSECGCEVGWTA